MPNTQIPESEWKWFGNAGHCIVGNQCRFHLCTQVGPWLVSTIDQAYMERFGFEEIGCGRCFETMVFRAGKPCDSPSCGCGLPELMMDNGGELDFASANDAKSATWNHRDMCRKWSAIPFVATTREEDDDDGA